MDSNKQLTRIFKLGLLLMNLRDLKILSILITFIKEMLYPVKAISTIENITMVKSI